MGITWCGSNPNNRH